MSSVQNYVPIESIEDISKLISTIKNIDYDNFTNSICNAIESMDLNELFYYSQVLVDTMNSSLFTPILSKVYYFDECTYMHSIRVAEYATFVGLKEKINGLDLIYLITGALLHDIGKLNISLDIINKPGRLSDFEYNIIKEHATVGYYTVIEKVKDVPMDILDVIYQHHENWNGTGYPSNLKGKDISRFAMIVHICDVYDALMSKRSYKESYSHNDVWSIMDSNCGEQFDPDMYIKFKEYFYYT